MNKYANSNNDLHTANASTNSDAMAMDLQFIRSRLLTKGLLYFAVVVPFALILSLLRVFEHGWHPIYLFHIGLTALIIAGAGFRKQLSYRARACFLLGSFLVIGAVGLLAFGLVGGGIVILIVFAITVAVAFGTRAGLIACIINVGIIVVTGAAVSTGTITFPFDISKYATSITAWAVTLVIFFLFVPVVVIALGIVQETLATSLRDLRESHAKHQRLVDNLAGTFLYRQDTNGVFNYVSSSVTQILGYSTEEFMTHFSEYLTDDPVNQAVVKHSEQSINGIQQPPFEVQIYCKGGSVYWLEVSETPLFDGDKNVVAVEGVAHDITERKKAEEVLRESDRMKTEFVNTVAHEFRTPLTSIQGFSEVLLTQDQFSPEEQKECLSYIHERSMALSDLVEDILDIARIESGKELSLNLSVCTVTEILRQVEPFLKTQASQRQFEVSLVDENTLLTVDKGKMGQVFENLLSNTVKFSVGESPIQIRGDLVEENYRFSVSDQGIGMSPEQVEKVFDKFYRVDASNTAVEGVGLGMHIVKNIVETLGGRIWVESELGQGTTVNFTLPLTQGIGNEK